MTRSRSCSDMPALSAAAAAAMDRSMSAAVVLIASISSGPLTSRYRGRLVLSRRCEEPSATAKSMRVNRYGIPSSTASERRPGPPICAHTLARVCSGPSRSDQPQTSASGALSAISATSKFGSTTAVCSAVTSSRHSRSLATGAKLHTYRQFADGYSTTQSRPAAAIWPRRSAIRSGFIWLLLFPGTPAFASRRPSAHDRAAGRGVHRALAGEGAEVHIGPGVVPGVVHRVGVVVMPVLHRVDDRGHEAAGQRRVLELVAAGPHRD